MNAILSCRWLVLIMLCIGPSNFSCKGPEKAPAADVVKAPSNLYLISYANSFVGALRAGGVAAGAFEVSRRTEADGLYHLKIDLMEDDVLKTLDLSYAGRDSELKPVSCKLGDEGEVEQYSNLDNRLTASHQVADLGARVEDGSVVDIPSIELLIDFRAGGEAGKVGRRYLRISDLVIREEFSDLEISEKVPYSFDLGFERDQNIGINSRRGRNLMRLGTGTEQQLQRFAQVVAWQRTQDFTRDFPALVEAVGIKIGEDSNAGYWSPLFNSPLRAGDIFAVRKVDGHAPAALIYVRESQRDMARLLVVRAPLGKDHGTNDQ